MQTVGPIKKLGTVWWFEFFVSLEPEVIEDITEQVTNIVTDFENRYSRFKADSVIGRLNSGAVVEYDKELRELLDIARTAYRDTDRVFNIAVGRRLESIGYDAEYSFTPEDEEQSIPDLDKVLIETESTVRLQDGCKIDFGGFAKGYLIDMLAKHIQDRWDIAYFLINGGGDMYVTSNNDEPVTINLADPRDSQQTIGSIDLINQGFAASSPHLRAWQGSDGTNYHHLVGNTNARPTFVTAGSASQADIWATTLSINPEVMVPQGVSYTVTE